MRKARPIGRAFCISGHLDAKLTQFGTQTALSVLLRDIKYLIRMRVGPDDAPWSMPALASDAMTPPVATTGERRPGAESADARVERTIATSRLILATAGLATVWLATMPPSWRLTVSLLLWGYAAFAFGCTIALRSRRVVPWTFGAATHLVDIAVAGSITLLTDGQDSPFFVFLNYPILTAAYRWGLQGTLATVATAVVILAIESGLLLEQHERTSLALGPFMRTEPVLRAAYLVVVGLLVGYLSDIEKLRRIEALTISRMLRAVRMGTSMDEAFDEVLRATVRLFGGRRALLVMHDQKSSRTFVRDSNFEINPTPPGAIAREIPDYEAEGYRFGLPGAAVHAVRNRFGDGSFSVTAVDNQSVSVDTTAVRLPAGLLPNDRCRRLLVVDMTFEGGWTARVLILDPRFVTDREEAARMAQRVAGQVGPALFEHYQLRRVRERASQAERARIVRELHDGPVQSLLSVDMELAVLRRQITTQAPQVAPDLARFHETLKREIVGLREVFEGVRAGAISARSIQRDLADVVTRFAIYTGLDARYSGDDQPVQLPANVRREVVRITQEALANVRKHSGARRVTVRTEQQSDQLLLHIEDNGRGFRWAGTRTQLELRDAGEGPWTILDRLRIVDGSVHITSKPGAGTTLALAFPIPPASGAGPGRQTPSAGARA